MCGGTIEVLIEPVRGTTASLVELFTALVDRRRPAAREMDLAPESVGNVARPGRQRCGRRHGRRGHRVRSGPARSAGVGHRCRPRRRARGGVRGPIRIRTARGRPATALRRAATARGLRGHRRLAGSRLRRAGPASRRLGGRPVPRPEDRRACALAALRADVAYVGAIGSRRAQADRRARLGAAGLGEAELARLHAPIGLDLGGRDPAEIALAIVAELVATRYGRSGGSRRDVDGAA